MRYARADATTAERGGRVPDNVVITPNSKNATVHPAITPLPLADWWVRYISKPGDIILDPFTGSGTVGVAALHHERHFLGIEKEAEYVAVANDRLEDAQDR
jgi:DNA modification methylase